MDIGYKFKVFWELFAVNGGWNNGFGDGIKRNVLPTDVNEALFVFLVPDVEKAQSSRHRDMRFIKALIETRCQPVRQSQNSDRLVQRCFPQKSESVVERKTRTRRHTADGTESVAGLLIQNGKIITVFIRRQTPFVFPADIRRQRFTVFVHDDKSVHFRTDKNAAIVKIGKVVQKTR